MSVLHDYVCRVHGKFEARKARCPFGCGESMVEKVFLKAPGIVSRFTRNVDAAMADQMAQYNLTDSHMDLSSTSMSMDDLKRTVPGTNLSAITGMKTDLNSLIPNANAPGVVAFDQKLTVPKPQTNVVMACDDAGRRIK